MNAKTRNGLKEIKKNFRDLGIRYIDSDDKKVINYVTKALSDVDTGAYICFGSVTYQEAIDASIDYLKVLGGDVFTKVTSLIKNVLFVPAFDSQTAYSCAVGFDSDDKGKIIKDSGLVENYNLPKNLYILSPLHISHEHLHLLKETNYDEFVDSQVIGDVITILYEFIMADTYPEIKREVLRYRLWSLKNDFKSYENACIHINKEKNDRDLYRVEATTSGQYLNSFYYAIILFNMYKENPRMILELVNKVLNHEITTREMLEMLGLLHQDKNSIFDSEFKLVKGIVK